MTALSESGEALIGLLALREEVEGLRVALKGLIKGLNAHIKLCDALKMCDRSLKLTLILGDLSAHEQGIDEGLCLLCCLIKRREAISCAPLQSRVC